jgi:hypothetical protein
VGYKGLRLGTSEAETGKRRVSSPPCLSPFLLLPSLSLPSTCFFVLQPTAEPAPCPLSHLWLPCPYPVPPWVPKGCFIMPQLPALSPQPPPLPACAEPMAACQGLGLPAEAETEISPLGRFSSAQRAWGLCLAPRSSPRALSR